MELSADTGNTVEVGSVGFSEVGLPVGLRLESIEDWDVVALKPAFVLELVFWLGLEIEVEVAGSCSGWPLVLESTGKYWKVLEAKKYWKVLESPGNLNTYAGKYWNFSHSTGKI